MTKYIGPKTADENVATQADKLSLSSATPDALTPDQAGAAGTATTAARSDHQHEILAGAAGTILPDDAAAEGASTSFARADHTHAITAAAPSANLTASTTNSEGTASSFARSDHSHAVTTGAPSSNLTASTSNATGTSASLSRADHSHAITTAAPGTILPDDIAATGTSASLARADHTHAIAAAAAGTITNSNAEGTSTSFARADHNHAYGAASIPQSALENGPIDACKAVRRTTQSIANGSFVFASFTAEDYDTNTMFSATDTKITIKTAGLYQVVGAGLFASNSTGRRMIILEKNAASAGNGTKLQRDIGPPTGDDVRILTVTWIGSLAVNDTIHMTLFQNSGGSLNAGSTDEDSLSLTVIRLRATP